MQIPNDERNWNQVEEIRKLIGFYNIVIRIEVRCRHYCKLFLKVRFLFDDPYLFVMMMAKCQSAADASELIKLQSSEGEIFEVPVRVAKVSRTISTMLSGLSGEIAEDSSSCFLLFFRLGSRAK